MDNTHLHLILNHFPIIGTLIATILLLSGVWTNNDSIKKVSLITIFVMAVIAIPVFLTGEPAEETVENLPGVTETIIEEHEEAAKISFWVMMAVGGMALLSLLMKLLHSQHLGKFIIASLLLSLAASVLMMRTGYLGGQIRHTEIRGNTQANSSNEQPNQEEEDD